MSLWSLMMTCTILLSMSFLHNKYGGSSFDCGNNELQGDKYVEAGHSLIRNKYYPLERYSRPFQTMRGFVFSSYHLSNGTGTMTVK